MLSFLKDNNFIWETGSAGHFCYGRYGKSLKDNIEKKLKTVFDEIDFFEIEAPMIYKNKVWKDSGHLDHFTDPILKTKKGDCFRLDKLIEEHFSYVQYGDLTMDVISLFIDEINEGIRKPGDKYILGDKIEYRNLMMALKSGNQNCSLRPETATSTYNNFINIFYSNNQSYPINVYQIGKVFRNEISPKNHILRAREFTQAEFQIILPKDKKNDPSMIIFDVPDSYQFDIVVDGKMKQIDIKELNVTDNYVYLSYIWFTYNMINRMGINKKKDAIKTTFEI